MNPLPATESPAAWVAWNDTAREGLHATLPELVEAQTRKTPDHPAVHYDRTVLTYRELGARANPLARLLIARGAGPEDLVAVALPRSAETVVAHLAVAKAGAAYVPIDIDHPQARIAALLASVAPHTVLTTAALAPQLPAGTPYLALDDPASAALLAVQDAADLAGADRLAPLRPEHAAYVIHTSGSTGAPKGVVVTHAGLASLAADHIERFGIGAGDGVLQFASFHFDCSVGDLLMALCSGAALIIRPRDCLAGHEVAALIERTGATHVTIPPQVLTALPPADYGTLRTIATAGDVLTAALVDQWAPGRRMFNAYGPTEATVDAVATEVSPARAASPAGTVPGTAATGIGPAGPAAADPPIGRPVVNTQVYVLDADLHPVPVGEEGELFIAGAGLARGYLNQPGLTAERFLPCPFGRPGARMYRTGDLARWRVDGELEFRGRVDQQVKIRGFRIEPGEVEAALATHPQVAHCVAVAREDRPGAKRLVGYVVPAAGAAPEPAALRAHLAARLPDHLVPSAVVVIDAFPLSRNGKLDRAALPAPELAGTATARAPRPGPEHLLCTLFAEVLGVTRVGPDDAFFDLGGDSVLAIRLAARVREAGWLLAPRDVFTLQRAAALADRLTPAPEPATEPAPAATNAGGPGLLTLSQEDIDDLTGEWANEF
ncbi:non-ribosomal peptide synthetase [Streptomyces sp. HSW2009]|uniref:non-ribosomal peptide synthetase n=1 Tax=Streptomyces sp. HSW2009 TaxID=3142890 RepID=UPI0032EC6E36